MAFKKGDPNINRNGRPNEEERLGKLTNRDLRKRELLMLLRKFKPHVASAIMKASDILDDKTAQHVNQLKAATIILDNYRRLVIDMYGDEVDPNDEAPQVQEENNKPLFSLTVIDGGKEGE